MKVGLLGGTFDPVHYGHLDVAHAARRALALDEIWLIPSRLPPHRTAPRASAAHRFAMVSLAIQDQNGLRVSDLEMETPGPSYTAETLDRLRDRGVDLGSVFFVIGADAFRDIAVWKDYPHVLDRCHFVVVSRPGAPAPALREALPALRNRMLDVPCAPPSQPSILLVDAPTAAVSSTDVRRSRFNGTSIEGLLPASVAAHIARHDLYGAPGPAGADFKGVA